MSLLSGGLGPPADLVLNRLCQPGATVRFDCILIVACPTSCNQAGHQACRISGRAVWRCESEKLSPVQPRAVISGHALRHACSCSCSAVASCPATGPGGFEAGKRRAFLLHSLGPADICAELRFKVAGQAEALYTNPGCCAR
jgi:hypothetical protein